LCMGTSSETLPQNHWCVNKQTNVYLRTEAISTGYPDAKADRPTQYQEVMEII
jgi:hypothetical protein